MTYEAIDGGSALPEDDGEWEYVEAWVVGEHLLSMEATIHVGVETDAQGMVVVRHGDDWSILTQQEFEDAGYQWGV